MLLAREDPQQGRLAGAVRPHEPDACLRPDGQAHLIENLLGAEVLRDFGELHPHRRTSLTESGKRGREERSEPGWSDQSVMGRRLGRRPHRNCRPGLVSAS
jgi:hypothetical protein